MSASKKEDDFQITKEELDKFQKAMENEEFRKLLLEYAQEISDPENKKKYEEEISQMEKERGIDIKFINPEGGFVVKTTRANDGLKAFVNICYNEHVQKATCQFAEKEENGIRKKGEQWRIPFSLSQPRDDFDNAGKTCVVFDVVFNPDTYKKGQQDPRFKETMINTALDGIQKQLNVKLNNKNLKFPKLKFKGVKQATVIRTKSKEHTDKVSHNNVNIGGQSFPYPYSNESYQEKNKHAKKDKNKEATMNGNGSDVAASNKDLLTESQTKKEISNEPVYHIVHRGVIDFQDYTNARDSCISTRPKELLVTIQLPKLNSTGTVELDIFEKQLLLHNEDPSYYLDLALPYPIDEANGHAKFDKSRRELVVTLPVIKPENVPYIQEKKPGDDSNMSTDKLQDKTELCNSNSHDNKINDNTANNLNLQEKDSIEAIDCNENASIDCDSKNHAVELNEMANGIKHELVSKGDITENGTGEEFDLGSVESTILVNEVIQGHQTDQEFLLKAKANLQDLHFEVTEMPWSFIFKSPPYTFHQDMDTVTFIVLVAGVCLENVSLGFNKNKCYINFPSEKPKTDHVPAPDYALYIAFPEGHDLCTDNCHIDVTENNLVLTLAKDDACKVLWDRFKVGPGEEELEDKYFIADNNLDCLMQEIAHKDPWVQQTQYSSDVKVLSVADDLLTVQLSKKISGVAKDNQDTTATSHVPQQQQDHSKGLSEKNHMESAKLENLDLKEGILSNKMQELKIQKLTSPDEGIVHDMYSHERREQYSCGITERIAASTDPKLVQDHGHKSNNDERRKNRSDSTDSLSSDRSDSGDGRLKSRSDSLDSVTSDRSDLTSSSTIPVRKSCIRRTSSTSTDDDTDYEFNNAISPSNGSWGSPGKRNVRFNLNPSVRVFSNKKDKQRWKMEHRLKNQKLSKRDNGEDMQGKTIHEEGNIAQDEALNNTTRQNSESSLDEEWTIVNKPSDTSLSNNLIFELDE